MAVQVSANGIARGRARTWKTTRPCLVGRRRASVRRCPNPPSAPPSPLRPPSPPPSAAAAGGEHAITIDAAARESRNLNEAGAQLDALQEHAMNSLGALVQQRSTLKGVQRKVLDMAQTGLSNDVLRMMEPRQFLGPPVSSSTAGCSRRSRCCGLCLALEASGRRVDHLPPTS